MLIFQALRRLSQPGRQFRIPEVPRVVLQQLPDAHKQGVDRNSFIKLFNVQQKYIQKGYYLAVEHQGKIYHLFNAAFYPLGRMMSRIAQYISAKNTPFYRKEVAIEGDVCVIVNIKDPLVTGGRIRNKIIRYHTGFVGHLKKLTYSQILQRKPRLLYQYVLSKMLPKRKNNRVYLDRLVTFQGPVHNFSFLPQFKPDNTDYIAKGFNQFKKREKQNLLKLSQDAQIYPSFDTPLVKQRRLMSDTKFIKLQARHLKMVRRYKKVSGLKKKKEQTEEQLQLVDSVKKAKKMDVYEQMMQAMNDGDNDDELDQPQEAFKEFKQKKL